MLLIYSLMCCSLLLEPAWGQLFPFTNIRKYFEHVNGNLRPQDQPKMKLGRPYRHSEGDKMGTSKILEKEIVIAKHAIDPSKEEVKTTVSSVFVTPRSPGVPSSSATYPGRPEKKRRRQKVVKPTERTPSRFRAKHPQVQFAESTIVESLPAVSFDERDHLLDYLVPPRLPSVYDSEDGTDEQLTEEEIVGHNYFWTGSRRPHLQKRVPSYAWPDRRTSKYRDERRQDSWKNDITNDTPFTASYLAGKNSKCERVEFQVHGEKGPNSYKFGYDTGKGPNRQFGSKKRPKWSYKRPLWVL